MFRVGVRRRVGGCMLERKERERETRGGGGREGLGLVAKEGR